MDNIRVSVVIPVYNREQTIEKAIRSVVEQTLAAYEIIIVNDGSTDHTADIVNNCIETYRDAKIKLINVFPNKGAQHARNEGIKHSKGEWVAFCDSDNEWFPDKLESQNKAILTQPKTEVVWSDYYIYKDGQYQYKDCHMQKEYKGDYTENIIFDSKIDFSTILVKREIIKDPHLLDEDVASYQEWDLAIQLCKKKCYFSYVNKPLFIYKILEIDSISKSSEKKIKGYRYIYMKNFPFFYQYNRECLLDYFYGLYRRYEESRSKKFYFYIIFYYLYKMNQKNEKVKNIWDHIQRIWFEHKVERKRHVKSSRIQNKFSKSV